MSQPHLHENSSSVPFVQRRASRVLLVTALTVNAAVLVVGSTVATFTGRDSVAQTNSAGQVLITLDDAGRADLALAGPALAAGDWFERAVTVAPAAGTIEIGSWTLSAKGAPGSLLDSSPGTGLQLQVERCTDAAGWTYTEVSGVRVHSCAGTDTRSTVLSQRDITMTDVPLVGLGAGAHHLLLTVKLSPEAPDTMQGLTSTIEYTFGGVQRAGTQR